VTEEPSEPAPPRRAPFAPIPAWAGPTTRLVHGARRPDWNAGALVPPIYQTSTFRYPAEFSESAARGGPYLYSRIDNPTVEIPTERLRQLEGAESARLFASGMGAITATVLSVVGSGDEVVTVGALYGGTTDLLADLARFGVRTRGVSSDDPTPPSELLAPATRLVLLESPSNPLMRVHDIAAWGDAADRAGAVLVVDNTFATPINQNPLALGADLVVHSATKYLGGHSDLLAGAVAGPERLVRRIDPKHALGAPLDPFAAFLLDRSLKTLALRVARQNESGRRVADALAAHPAVARVHYPGRAGPRDEAIAARQMRGRGGMVGLSLAGGAPAVDRFLRALSLVQVASSLGGVESLASVPAVTSHRNDPPAKRHALGIDDGFVRLSLGIEDPEDLVRDLTAALDAAGPASPAAPL
jgi:cystathionine beta-lyase/cystathionine gamma-synthase